MNPAELFTDQNQEAKRHKSHHPPEAHFSGSAALSAVTQSEYLKNVVYLKITGTQSDS